MLTTTTIGKQSGKSRIRKIQQKSFFNKLMGRKKMRKNNQFYIKRHYQANVMYGPIWILIQTKL